ALTAAEVAASFKAGVARTRATPAPPALRPGDSLLDLPVRSADDLLRLVPGGPADQAALVLQGEQTWKLLEAATGKTVHEFSGHEKAITGLDISADRKRALTGSKDKPVRLWDLETGKAVHVLKGHDQAVAAAVFSPDGTQAASADLGKMVRLWDLATGKTVRQLPNPSGISCVAFS